MKRIRLVHWNAKEAKDRAKTLAVRGYEVNSKVPQGPDFFRELRNDPPSAIAISLDRLPSQGREIALAIRHAKGTRQIPIVFAGGEAEMIARIRELIPDAGFASWDEIHIAIKKAIANPPAQPVVPQSVFEAYSKTPLVKKLGIKANSVVGLLGAPSDFHETLGELPEGVQLRKGAEAKSELLLWFVRSNQELQRDVREMAKKVGGGAIWIIWPKKSSGMATDVAEPLVREAGLSTGLVDYKICAVDLTWSGLLFTRRKPQKTRKKGASV